jgi:ribosomal protein S12 methylthiotransferase
MQDDEYTRTYHLVTLGCAKNEIDSEALEMDMLATGLVKVEDSRLADLLIVSSCGFINEAKAESIHTVLDLHQDRKKGSVLVLCGCLPARYDLSRSLNEVDIFLPWKKHGELIPRLREIGWHIENIRSENRRMPPNPSYGYLRVSEGCDNRCSYCAIPDIKGPFKSRPPAEIAAEAKYLCDGGVRELVIIGQDTSLYGRDGDEGTTLATLIEKLSELSCDWIRVMYAHPAHLDDSSIEAMAESAKVVKYIDLPLQHVSDRVLRSMNRKVTRQDIEKLIADLRGRMPGIALRTTFIVGFPGETDADFEELLDFCEAAKFENVGIFKYSREDGTPAYSFGGQVDEGVIDERYLTLMDVQNKISGEKLNRLVNTRERVLLDRVEPDGRGYARGWFQAPEVDGAVIIDDCEAQPGSFIDVVVERCEAYDLYAKLVDWR